MNNTIFISYSHQDKKWLERLIPYLQTFEFEGLDKPWHDGMIGGGTDWFAAIEAAIRNADLAILLISPNFLASSFIRHEEVPRLLERRASEGLPILPVLVRPCNWETVKWLAAMQIRPEGARALSYGPAYKRDEALKRIAEEANAIIHLKQPSHPAEVPSELRATSPLERLIIPKGALRPAEYIFYLSGERLASLFAQVDPGTLANPRYPYQEGALIPLGDAPVPPDRERRRQAAVSQLATVLDYLEKNARIGDLAKIVQTGGHLDCDWYTCEAEFRSESWKPRTPEISLSGKIGNYQLLLSCAKSNFTGLSKEGELYTPTSINKYLFEGTVGLKLHGLVRLAGVDRQEKILRGTALYLVLSRDLGSIDDGDAAIQN